MFRIILIILGCIFAVFALGMGCFGAFIALNNRPAGEAKEVLAAAQTGAPKAIVVYQPARTGVTTKAAHQIAKALQENGYEVTLNHPGSFLEQDLSAYSVVMFGSPVYIGQPSKVLLDYMKGATGLEGKKVYQFATKAIENSVNKILLDCGLVKDNIEKVIPHQANLRIIEKAAELLTIDMSKFFINIDKYGNTSAASIAIALDEYLDTLTERDNKKIILVGFGGGFTWGAALLTL
jgi:predicted naringenin-chalcone synthase